jgi:RsiW-degrading membrane proteinase PrsW (M82 family)
VVLVLLGMFLVGFIAAMTVIFCVKGSVPDTLIQYTLGAGGVEALLLAGIKISKVMRGEQENA